MEELAKLLEAFCTENDNLKRIEIERQLKTFGILLNY